MTEIASAVSNTALMVAAARAIEHTHPHSLVHDEFAEHFVLAAGTTPGLPTTLGEVPAGDNDPVWGRGARYFALRTRTFDDFLTGSVTSAPQLVLLGSGLDSRAYRLDWPNGATMFEVDLSDVQAFKSEVLIGLGASPGLGHRLVAADLAEDWPTALLAAGFEPGTPTTWLVEGVIPYLPAPVERGVFAAVDQLSAPGSRLAYEILVGQETTEVRDDELYATTEEKLGTKLSSLFAADDRPDTFTTLRGLGWSLRQELVAEAEARYGRGPGTGDGPDPIAAARWISGGKEPRPARA